jgi:hypothetical protein
MLNHPQATAAANDAKGDGFCYCVEQANDALNEKYPGVKVLAGLGDLGRAAVATYRESGRGRMPTLFASYCPFCGVKYED